MITGELKSKVDDIWDTMWSGGVSNPLTVFEQLTHLLFMALFLRLLQKGGQAAVMVPDGQGELMGAGAVIVSV